MADRQRAESLDSRLLLRLAGQWRFLPALSTDGRLTLFLLPTYSPKLNPPRMTAADVAMGPRLAELVQPDRPPLEPEFGRVGSASTRPPHFTFHIIFAASAQPMTRTTQMKHFTPPADFTRQCTRFAPATRAATATATGGSGRASRHDQRDQTAPEREGKGREVIKHER
jgi:hypothetical protein